MTTTETRITWLCGVCGEPVADGEGYIELLKSEEVRYVREMAEFTEGSRWYQRQKARHGDDPGHNPEPGDSWRPVDMSDIVARIRNGTLTDPREQIDSLIEAAIAGPRMINGAELGSVPKEAQWWAVHGECDPDTESSSYWFGVERCRTLADLADWSAHLNGKRWITNTNWFDIAAHLNRNPTIRIKTPPSLGTN